MSADIIVDKSTVVTKSEFAFLTEDKEVRPADFTVVAIPVERRTVAATDPKL